MLRLSRGGKEEELTLTIDLPEAGDQELFSAGEKVLVVDSELSDALPNFVLAYKDTSQGRRFIFEEGAA
ncbi:MAG: hypothetical protein ACE5JD_05500 [Candidatus Methylomirabilia bacterium]